jgi:hypothetical protein
MNQSRDSRTKSWKAKEKPRMNAGLRRDMKIDFGAVK